MPPSRYARKSGCRIPHFFYIASEGTVTEIDYFSSLKGSLRLENVEIIPITKAPGDTNSDPEYTVKVASDYCKANKIKPSQTIRVAIVADFDRWRHKLAKACQDCRRRHFDFYVSNPCIELWFLLHFHDLSTWDPALLTPCRKCKQLFGSTKISSLYENTEQALRNAEKIWKNTHTAWPQNVGTNLHHLINTILNT